MRNGTNRNARRSVRLLKEALVELLVESPYDRISVSDVTRRADLNRGTFYAHFDDMDDLLRSVLDDFAEAVSRIVNNADVAGTFENPMPLLEKIGSYLEQNRTLFRQIAESSGRQSLILSLEGIVKQKVREHVTDYIAKSDLPYDGRFGVIASEYVVDGVIGVYRAWLVGDYGDDVPIKAVNDNLAVAVSSMARGMSA